MTRIWAFVLSAGVALAAESLSYTAPRWDDEGRMARIEAALPRLDEIYAAHAVSNHIPGYVYGVVVDGRLIHVRAAGLATLTPERPVTEETRFRIASMTKSFTAMAILKLRDAGRLTLEDPVERWIPQFARVKATTTDSPKITLRHLLRMSSGFPQDDPWGDRRLEDTVRQLESLVSGGLAFSNPPGVTWEYSNLGYALLGQVVSRASGRPFQEYITREILRPLGMTNTLWEFAKVPDGRMAQGYRWENDRWREEPLLHDGTFGAMGGLITTVGDFSKYVAFHLDAWPPRDGPDPGPVRRSTRREMHRPAEVLSVMTNLVTLDGFPNPRVAGYSFGLSWNQDARGVIWLRHGGGLPGFGSEHRFLPEYGIGLVSFANRTYAPMTAANAAAMEVLIGAARIPPRQAVASPLLKRRAAQVASILQSWEAAEMADALAPNVFQDRDLSDWKAMAGETLSWCGKIQSVSELRPENQLRGRFDLIGDLGSVEVFFTLMPEAIPRVQEIKLTFKPVPRP
ncbi:MAG: beta-lactamase family protein [Verrucomicrobiales bacterium]|nr:beta-lactamase family protein [Verrucomicrobiales bacterium]